MGRATREAVRSWPVAPVKSMFDHVYAEAHPLVEAERAWFTKYEASFADVEAKR